MNRIAVFDSGLGGLTVLKKITELLPDADIIYYGDSKNAPYGTRTEDDIRGLSENCVKKLQSSGAGIIVIACNTATSAAYDYLKEKHPDLAVFGIRPDLIKACEENPGKNILLMATSATCNGNYISKVCREYSEKAEIDRLPCPKIVTLVEQGKLDSAELKEYLHEILLPYKEKTDAVVLGCTHFPFVKKVIAECFDKDVKFYDAAESVAKAVCDYVKDNNITFGSDAKLTFLNSDDTVTEREKKLYKLY